MEGLEYDLIGKVVVKTNRYRLEDGTLGRVSAVLPGGLLFQSMGGGNFHKFLSWEQVEGLEFVEVSIWNRISEKEIRQREETRAEIKERGLAYWTDPRPKTD